MGFRFRRSIRILPGLRLNFGKRGVSASVGVRGAHVTIGKDGTRTTVGVPGTGLSYTEYERHGNVRGVEPPPSGAEEGRVSMVPALLVLLLVVLAVAWCAKG